IGFIKIVYTERVQDGVERLGYAVGLQALKAVQQQERLLWKVSEVLSAPVEKLDKTAEKIVKELKEATAAKRKLTKEKAREIAGARVSATASFQAYVIKKPIMVDDITISKIESGRETDADLMVQSANEIIRKDEGTVVIMSSSDGKTARILVMAGKAALEKGVHAGEVVKTVSPIIGGGGGGRPNFAQGGGTQPEKLQEAIEKAEETIRKQLRH
ncbi:MAG TPA: DHHA1 domain-containing protein, partial [Candidatus Bathyarchaeia archaeon]